jgi:hypothetical protein
VDIRRITDSEAVKAAQALFDHRLRQEAVDRFLGDDGHHLLIAYMDDLPAGMITGVEMKP